MGIFILFYGFGQMSSVNIAFGLWNLCYSQISVVIFLGYKIVGISRKLEFVLRSIPFLKKFLVTNIVGAQKSRFIGSAHLITQNI